MKLHNVNGESSASSYHRNFDERLVLTHLTHPTQLTYLAHPTHATHLTFVRL